MRCGETVRAPGGEKKCMQISNTRVLKRICLISEGARMHVCEKACVRERLHARVRGCENIWVQVRMRARNRACGNASMQAGAHSGYDKLD